YLARIHQSEHDLVLGLVVAATDKLIGATGLHEIDLYNRHACFGISIGEKDEWGKGYGTEATEIMTRYAFETLNFNRLWLRVYEFNERGIRSYGRVGFKKEGVMRQDVFREGRYWDTWIMGMLRQEWLAKKNSPRTPESGSP